MDCAELLEEGRALDGMVSTSSPILKKKSCLDALGFWVLMFRIGKLN